MPTQKSYIDSLSHLGTPEHAKESVQTRQYSGQWHRQTLLNVAP